MDCVRLYAFKLYKYHLAYKTFKIFLGGKLELSASSFTGFTWFLYCWLDVWLLCPVPCVVSGSLLTAEIDSKGSGHT